MSGGLPKGWVLTPVSSICEQIRGVSYAKDDVLFEPREGHIPLLRANNINGEINFKDLQYVPMEIVSSKQFLQIGDVVLAMSSGSKKVVGKSAPIAVKWNGTFGAFCGVLRPATALNSSYFAFFFQTKEYRNKISELATGTNINNIRAVYFEMIAFPLAPLNEQKRIVAKLDAIMPRIDSVKERLEKIPAMLKRFRQSVLTAAVTGKLTEKWREEHPEVESAEELLQRICEEREVRYQNACEEAKKKGARQPKRYREIIEQNNLVKEVDSWAWTYLANVAEVSGGVTKGRVLQGNDIVKLPYLRVANVQDGYLDLSEMKEIEIKKQELDRYALMNGDILFTQLSQDLENRKWLS